MISKKSGLVNIGWGILSFLLVVVFSEACTRPIEDNPYACNYIYCMNGGRCDSAKCKCPVGFEGSDCSVSTVTKFVGYWKMHAVVAGSDSANLIGTYKDYTVDLRSSASNTTFFMHGFDNNPYYSNIVCKIDSNDKSVVSIDTTSVLNMYYDHYRIRAGWMTLYHGDSLQGIAFVRRLNATVNWQTDTVILTARKL